MIIKEASGAILRLGSYPASLPRSDLCLHGQFALMSSCRILRRFGFSGDGARLTLAVMIEDFGGRVATIWSELRPTTRQLVERALQQTKSGSAATARSTPYDARADLELSRLLAALDEGASELGVAPSKDHKNELRAIADTCASVLQDETQSAEVFVQLVQRAQSKSDYRRIDSLADTLTSRFAPSEICELARSQNVVVRALAQEALTQAPTSVLIGILHDPIDSEIARDALQRQARDYGSEEARQIIAILDRLDLDSEEL